jgi:hypothetical protein
MAPGEALDVAGLRLQKEVTIAQLRSVNALLERQVGAAAGGRLAGSWGWAGGAVGDVACMLH